MNINKITAIFDEFRLKDVEDALLKHKVTGFTLYPVSGMAIILIPIIKAI